VTALVMVSLHPCPSNSLRANVGSGNTGIAGKSSRIQNVVKTAADDAFDIDGVSLPTPAPDTVQL